MIRCNRLVLAMVLAIAAPLAAQRSGSEVEAFARLPAVPADHILDVADLFRRHAERREAISQRLRGLQAEHNLPIYVAVYDSLLDSTLEKRARELYEHWIGPGREGIVVVCETDSLRREIATPSGQLIGAGSGSGEVRRLPDYRLIQILAELRVTLDGVEDRIDYIDRTSEILATRVGEVLGEKPGGAGGGATLRFVTVILLVGVLLALLGVFVNRRLRNGEERARERDHFPDVMVGTRLGAPYAGGRGSVVEFSRKEPPSR